MFAGLQRATTLMTAAAVACHLLWGCCHAASNECRADEPAAHADEHEGACEHDHAVEHRHGEGGDHDAPHGEPCDGHAPCGGHCAIHCAFASTLAESAHFEITPPAPTDFVAVVDDLARTTETALFFLTQPPPGPAGTVGLSVYLCALRI